MKNRSPVDPTDLFAPRHIGSAPDQLQAMLGSLGFDSLDRLSDAIVPDDIRLRRDLRLGPPRSESRALAELRQIARHNEVYRSFIGLGYHGCITPPVIQRNILENPGWYTQYTPYQAEIAQGRLEALLNFQTMVADLTALPMANASLLDEATAAAEAMSLCLAASRATAKTFFVADDCHPQTIAVVRTRAGAAGIEVRTGDARQIDFSAGELFAVLVQYPTTDGRVRDYAPLAHAAHEAGALLVVATDLLALTLLRPPGEFGADVAIGSSQRFGVPMGYGGPHAAFLATREEFRRLIPGRIVGVSRDDRGKTGYRLALQTREQHIRRDKATSNICTAQVLLAVMAAMYGVYHGADGLRRIARRVHDLTRMLANGLHRLGWSTGDEPFFDTLRVEVGREDAQRVQAAAHRHRINLRDYGDGSLGVALDETATEEDLQGLLEAFALDRPLELSFDELAHGDFDAIFARTSEFMTAECFKLYHTEHEMLRYLKRLQDRDLSLAHAMIPLGSCTMKLNGTSQMMPVSWPEFAALHPFAAADQRLGYEKMFRQLESWLAEITGFRAVSLQPNAGAQGEYAGLLVIRAYHRERGQAERDVCLIPTSAHGTNPASAVMAGLRVVPVVCDAAGNIDLGDLERKADEHADRLAAIMITYPSTHGVFEHGVRRICDIVHRRGGQVYLDGANLNAQVGLCRPGDYGADVCHLNLHKTFCIPHGGGGPGMGPIAVAEHLVDFLPGHPLVPTGGDRAIGPVSAAPYGSAGILPISWMYIAMMGADGLRRASQVAILNANYMAHRLRDHFPILYSGAGGRVAHEFIIDLRPFKESAGVTVDDVAKRLMDYGLHAPTMSWPVAGTFMIEPTESESRDELDRFCEAMIAIRAEIREIEEGQADRADNLLKRAPHTAEALLDDGWDRPYGRERAAFPLPWVRERKFWPAVGRVDNAYGDRHLVCTCASVEAYVEP
ncbi:MAG TPA: aminomethyl-transferring glycine dehydrogenase [Candidatus Polarisedimenticolaceae bacterium]|nr:aminomethyl-transferring glycine dehydrogenase [Candidatus Polarisedimenticolaceae bacterium]